MTKCLLLDNKDIQYISTMKDEINAVIALKEMLPNKDTLRIIIPQKNLSPSPTNKNEIIKHIEKLMLDNNIFPNELNISDE